MSFLSNLGKNIEGIVKIGTGFAAGGPAGALGAAATMMRPGGAGPPAPQPTNQPGIFGGFNLPGIAAASGGITLGGSKTTSYTGTAGYQTSSGGGCPSGYHLNKHALPACKTHGATAARTICVRNRSMNPMNGRAVARAARRIHKGEKLLRKIFSVEGKHHGKIKPKAHSRSR